MAGIHGRGGGRKRGRRRQMRVMSFIQPCLLLMLHRGKAHGYNLLSGLGEFGFASDHLDPSLVYRALHDMEESGLVTSEWDADDSLGPQRRIYCITKLGENGLTEWISDLRRTRQEIGTLIAAYEQVEQHDKGGDGS